MILLLGIIIAAFVFGGPVVGMLAIIIFILTNPFEQ